MARRIAPRPLPSPEGYDDSDMVEVMDSMGFNGRRIIAALNGDVYCSDSDVEAWNDAVTRINAGAEEEED
jgi:hypothetical protein